MNATAPDLRPRTTRWPFANLERVLNTAGLVAVDLGNTFYPGEAPAAPPSDKPIAATPLGGPGEPERTRLMPWRFI